MLQAILAFVKEELRLTVASYAKDDELTNLFRPPPAVTLVKLLHRTMPTIQKPDPDIVQAAMKRRHYPESVVLLGDTPYDVKMVEAAGVEK